MNKHFLRLTTFIAAVITHALNAQTPGTFPIFPQVWTQNNVPVTSQAYGDANFTTMLSYKTPYGRTVGPYPAGLVADPSNPASAAWAVVRTYQLKHQGKHMALQLNLVGTRGLWKFNSPTTYTTELGTTRMYQHPDDHIRPNGLEAPASIRVKRSPWMDAGINETRAWSSIFFSELARRINESNGAIPRPRHVIFDEEIHVIGKELTLPDLILYWQGIQADPRFNSATIRVPGLTTSLRDNWIAAGSPQLAVVTGPINWRYWWGSESNQRWWTWWSQVCHTAYAGAIDQSFYQFVRLHFPPNASYPTSPLCSDYDQSLVLDGAVNPELPQNGPANSYLSYEPLGAYGPSGQRFILKQPGNISNIAQAPHLYGDFSLLHLQYFNGTTFGNAAWATSDDNLPFVPAPEQWGSMQARMIRHRLAACVKSAAGRSRPITPWLTLPNQFTSVGVDNGGGVQQYRGQRFPMAMPVRISNTLVTRTLAHCKAHGVKEVILWNDSDVSLDGPIYNWGLHSQWPINYDLFKQAAANAYGFVSVAASAANYNDVTLPSNRSLTGGMPIADLLAFADSDYSEPTAGRVNVSNPTAAGSGGVWFVTRFRKMTDNVPTRLEFNFELKPTHDSRLLLYVRGNNQSTWTQVTDSGLKDANNNSTGSFPYTLTANRTSRVRAAIPYSPDYFPGGNGEFHVALYILPVTIAPPFAVDFDLIQVYGLNPKLRPVGDINGDYVYNPAQDRTMLADIMVDLFYNTGNFKPRDRPLLDFDRNGQLNWNDLAAYDSLVANGAGYLLIDDDRFSTSERP